MADVSKNIRDVWMKGMEAISTTANRIAETTKCKVNEMSIANRRGEILKDFGAKAYALWQKGEVFPAELDELLQELHQMEMELSEIRAKKAEETPVSEQPDQEEASDEDDDGPADTDDESEIAAEAETTCEAPVIEVETAEENAPVENTDDEVPTIQVEE